MSSFVLMFLDAPWPPPDPEKIPRRISSYQQQAAFTHGQDNMTTQEQLAAFRRRQHEDLKRFDGGTTSAIDHRLVQVQYFEDHEVHDRGGHEWRDPEGEGLDDFGVDENVDFYDLDDIPLAELKKRNSSSKAY